MKKLLAVIAVVCAITVQLRAQNNNNPGGPANIAGNLYASNFAAWNVPQGNNGPLSWSYSSACSSATSGGTTFKPLIVGAPIRIVDSDPSLSENVTVTAVRVAGSGCLINVTPSNPHLNFYLTTSTGGLQEAINFANGQQYVVILTPDWKRAGGNDGMIAAAKGNNSVSLLDQRTSVSTPYLWNGSTYVATPYGGGALLPNPGIVFGLTSSTGRVMVLSDLVATAAPAIWNGSPCAVGTNALLANGQCGPSGGSTIPGSIHQQIFSAGGGAATASNATLDAAGNSKTLSNDGTFNAFTAQTTPTSNDGIKNALQTTGNFVVAGNDYPCTEGTYSGSAPLFSGAGNYRLGIGNPAPFANGTELIDMRGLCGAQGVYSYNPYYNATPGTWKYDRIVENHLPQTTAGGVSNFFHRSDTEFTGSGINSGFTSVGPDSEGRTFDSLELMTRGIQSVNNIEEQAYSQGDNHIRQIQITNNRGSTDINGEGFNTDRNEIGQNLTPMVMLANSTLAAGATLIQGTLNGNVPFPGDGTYLIDSTRAGPIVQIINETGPSVTEAGQWQVNTTLTPDNIGRVAAGLGSIPIQRYGATTNATVTITGLTSALSTSQSACVADHIFQESVRIVNAGSFSGGTATGVVLALRYPHLPSFYVAQGSHTCNVMEIKANGEIGSPPSRQLFRIIGVEAGSPNHYLYSRTTFGGWDGGLSGYAKTYDVANAGTTLTRNGSGVVTVPVSDGGQVLSSAFFTVAGCADTSFNGVFQAASDTGSAVTWANAGAAGTTTCTKDIEVLSKLNNAFGIRDAQEFPAAEIVNTVDPVTFANNFNLSVEPNTNLHVIAGDQLENHPYADVIMGFDRNIMTFQSQTTPSASQLMHFDQVGGATPEGISWYRIAFTDSPVGYQGLGGSKGIGANLMDMSDTTTPFRSLFENLPMPTDSIFSFNGCPYGCSNPKSNADFFNFAMDGGSYSQNINQADHTVATLNQNITTNELFNKIETDQGFSYFTNNGQSGTSQQENYFLWVPGQTQIATASNSGSIKNTFNMTPTGTSFSQPVTVPTLISGAINATGAVTVGGTGHSIGTGTASNTDLAGKVTLSGGAATQALAGTYTTAPIVTCTDVTTAAAVKCVASTTAITFTGTGTDVINYILIGLN